VIGGATPNGANGSGNGTSNGMSNGMSNGAANGTGNGAAAVVHRTIDITGSEPVVSGHLAVGRTTGSGAGPVR
jgi:hypothetical protein